MTPISADFSERMIEEINAFIQSQGRALSLTDIARLIVDLPALRQRFVKIPRHTYPYLADQLQFLSLVVEDLAVRDPAGEVVGEAAFALLYFQRSSDLIPDTIPGMGLLDDEMIVHLVLGRHEETFKSGSYAYKLRWPARSVDVDQLLSVVSPLRLNSVYLSMASPANLSVAD
jgi:uncharacterized membrane protein YkvA (DUF1232 family)